MLQQQYKIIRDIIRYCQGHTQSSRGACTSDASKNIRKSTKIMGEIFSFRSILLTSNLFPEEAKSRSNKQQSKKARDGRLLIVMMFTLLGQNAPQVGKRRRLGRRLASAETCCRGVRTPRCEIRTTGRFRSSITPPTP